MATRILRTPSDLEGWKRFLDGFQLPCTVSVIKGAERSGQQNRTVHKWFSQIGDEFGEPAHTVKARCKYRFGLPIMIRDNPRWVEKWSPLYSPILSDGTAEQKALAFEAVPMTSEFTTKQMAEFMTAIQTEYLPKGVALIDPEAMKYQKEMQGD